MIAAYYMWLSSYLRNPRETIAILTLYMFCKANHSNTGPNGSSL